MKIKYSSLKCFLVSFIFVFADVLGGGNLNLTYLLGATMIIPLLRDKRYFRRLLLLWVPLLLIVTLTSQFSGIQQNSTKVVVYLAKLLFCITLMYYIEKNFKRIDFPTIYGHALNLVIILLIVSLILRNSSVLWRLNDIYNNFSKVRLQLLFTEPSVLGHFTGVMIIFGVFTFINNKVILSEKFKFALLVLTMLLSFAMSGIVYTIISCSLLIALSFGKDIFSGKIKKSIFTVLIIGVLIFSYILITNNVLSQRLVAIFAGNDGSFNFRWYVAYSSLGGILQKSNYFGIGMGNMNTVLGESILLAENVDHFFANSFMYFIAENGIPGLIYIIYLIFIIINKMKRSFSGDNSFNLKFSLFVFVIISQIAGEYFTDPFVWCLYGIICAQGISKENVTVFRGRKKNGIKGINSYSDI